MIRETLVKKALSVIGSSPSNHQYFFERLDSPEWIEPLRKAGRFKRPAQLLVEEGGIRFPDWPESKYLSRMAPRVPELVRDVITEADRTDNERVHQDYIEAALRMPVAIAADIAKLEAAWIQTRERLYTLYPEKMGDLVSYLANGEITKPALSAARALLSIGPPAGASIPDIDDADELNFPLEPIGKCDHWHYRRVLEKSIPPLTNAAPEPTLRLLADLLSTAMKIHCRGDNAPEEDFSWIWRPRIESENHEDLKDSLVSAVRDAAIQETTTTRSDIVPIVQILLDHEWRIFRRLAAYVVDKSEFMPLDALRIVLARRVEYENFPGRSPEFDQLLRKSFDVLPVADKDSILSIIKLGPRMSVSKAGRDHGESATGAEMAESADLWRLNWLRQIRDSLPEEWRQAYATLVARFGEPSLNEPLFRSGGPFVGPTSPKSDTELRELTPDELIDFLQRWHSSGDWNAPSPEGLGRALTAMLSSEPERLAAHADQLRGLDPTYVRSAIEGFREAAKGGKTLPWQPVLSLCHWIVSQPLEIPGRRTTLGDSDPDWSWTRTATARLMLDALQHDRGASLNSAHRAAVWDIVSRLLSDPDPYETVQQDYAKGMFIGSLSLNTTRGVAFEAAIEYGLWINRYSRQPQSNDAASLSDIPELNAILQNHLEDPSPSVREVYGRRFPWLVELDRTWATSSADSIFQKREGDLGQIALANYILFNRPYDNVVPIMLPHYEYAIDTIGHSFRHENDEIDRHLAVHVMNLYWSGKLVLEDEESILHSFFAKAPDRLRGHAIWAVGRSLYDEKGDLTADIIDRLKRLWDWRLTETRDLKGDRESIRFGYWFASGKFRLTWCMANLLDVLQLRHKVEPDYIVAEQLVVAAKERPLDAVQALGLMIEGDREGWSISGWKDHAREVLAIALSSGEEAQVEAIRVVNLLGARGHFGYRDLLKK
jgi:hypothetical protein